MNSHQYDWLLETVPRQYHHYSFKKWDEQIKCLRQVKPGHKVILVAVLHEVLLRLLFEMRPEVQDGWLAYARWATFVVYYLVPLCRHIKPNDWTLKEVRSLLADDEEFSKALLFGDQAAYSQALVGDTTQLSETVPVSLTPEQDKLFRAFQTELQPDRKLESRAGKWVIQQKEQVAQTLADTLKVASRRLFERLFPQSAFLRQERQATDMKALPKLKPNGGKLLHRNRRLRPFEQELYDSLVCVGLVSAGRLSPVATKVLPERILNRALAFVLVVFLVCLGLFAGANQPSKRTRRR